MIAAAPAAAPRLGRVLVVDDDPQVLAACVDELSETWDVAQASDPFQALSILRAPGPAFDAVVSDARMPGMGGVELLRHVAEQSPSIVRVLLTGYADSDVRSEALREGGAFKVSKPWGDTLEVVLRRGVEAQRAAARSGSREAALGRWLGVLEDTLHRIRASGPDRRMDVGRRARNALHVLRASVEHDRSTVTAGAPLDAAMVEDRAWAIGEIEQAFEHIIEPLLQHAPVVAPAAETLDVRQIVDRVRHALAQQSPEAGAFVDFEIAPGCPRSLDVDVAMLEIALVNLVAVGFDAFTTARVRVSFAAHDADLVAVELSGGRGQPLWDAVAHAIDTPSESAPTSEIRLACAALASLGAIVVPCPAALTLLVPSPAVEDASAT